MQDLDLLSIANAMKAVQTASTTTKKQDEWKSYNCFVGTTFLFQTRCTEKGTAAVEAYLNGLVSKSLLTSFSAEKKEATVLSADDISALFA